MQRLFFQYEAVSLQLNRVSVFLILNCQILQLIMCAKPEKRESGTVQLGLIFLVMKDLGAYTGEEVEGLPKP